MSGQQKRARPGDVGEAEQRFVEDLIARGEAVPEGTDPLPSGATHEIVEEGDGGIARVRRRRFSIVD